MSLALYIILYMFLCHILSGFDFIIYGKWKVRCLIYIIHLLHIHIGDHTDGKMLNQIEVFILRGFLCSCESKWQLQTEEKSLWNSYVNKADEQIIETCTIWWTVSLILVCSFFEKMDNFRGIIWRQTCDAGNNVSKLASCCVMWHVCAMVMWSSHVPELHNFF